MVSVVAVVLIALTRLQSGGPGDVAPALGDVAELPGKEADEPSRNGRAELRSDQQGGAPRVAGGAPAGPPGLAGIASAAPDDRPGRGIASLLLERLVWEGRQCDL